MDRKELIRKYKETPRPAGVYRVQHSPSRRVLLGSSSDAPDAFDFEVLDLLPPSETPESDQAEELSTLEGLWREKLDLGNGSMY